MSAHVFFFLGYLDPYYRKIIHFLPSIPGKRHTESLHCHSRYLYEGFAVYFVGEAFEMTLVIVDDSE